MFSYYYIDAFAGSGIHVSRTTKELIPGSPTNALWIDPPFHEYHFIDLDKKKVESLEEIAKGQENVHIYEGDCNEILIKEIFPKIQWKDFRRALCILDPYGLDLNWEVIETTGKMKTFDIFLNFPYLDMNRNVLRRNSEVVSDSQIKRMDSFWGDDSWKKLAYKTGDTLFDEWKIEEKVSPAEFVDGFRKRLVSVAGFEYVPEPIVMRNMRNGILYYLLFASQKCVAEDIIKDIFKKYKR
ncbi:MAG: three-Cys-motif partner protein TcmP [Candidatus Omnitrophota bacterium]